MENNRRRWLALGLLTAVEFLIFLDIAIVNIAVPSIQTDLGLDGPQVTWVVAAYQLVFAGFLLLGGRAGDIVGTRRVYLIGLSMFTLGSLGAGLADDLVVLTAARGLQGLGAAALVPTALAQMETVFGGTAQYHKAFGIWGAMRSAGASSGVALGGLITYWAGWPFIFLINVPLCLFVLALGLKFLPRTNRPVTTRRARLDIPGALVVTVGLLLVVSVLGEGGHRVGPGWLAPVALAFGVGLLGVFPLLEMRAAEPLVPMRLFRNRAISVSLVASFLVGISHLALFYFLSLYMQQVAGYDAMQAGLAMLPIGALVLTYATVIMPKALARYGHRKILLLGLGALTVSLGLLARLPLEPNYFIDILPISILVAVGLPSAFVGVTVPAVQAAPPQDRGVTAGLVNVVQRIGGGIGITLLTVAASWAAGAPASTDRAGMLDEFRFGFGAAALVTLLAVVAVAMWLPRPQAAGAAASSADTPTPSPADTAASGTEVSEPVGAEPTDRQPAASTAGPR